MKVSITNQTNFKGVYIDKNITTKKEKRIAQDIQEKLNQKYPNDLKNRNHLQYLKENNSVDILITRTPFTINKVSVLGVVGAKTDKDVYTSKDFFVAGEYDTTNFDTKDIDVDLYNSEDQSTESSFSMKAAYVLALILALSSLFFVLFSKRTGNSKELPQTVTEVRHSISDCLKNVKTINF